MQLGIDDPERWLANAPKRVVRTWEAYWQLEPWGQPWHRHASFMVMLDFIYARLLEKVTGGQSKYKPRGFGDWMPGDWSPEIKPEPQGDATENLDAFVKATSR